MIYRDIPWNHPMLSMRFYSHISVLGYDTQFFLWTRLDFVFVSLSQVGFKSISDYITYTWVKDDQVAFVDDLFQVCLQLDFLHTLLFKAQISGA